MQLKKSCSTIPAALVAALALTFIASRSQTSILYYDGGTASLGGTGNSQASGITGNWNNALLNWNASLVSYIVWDNPGKENGKHENARNLIGLKALLRSPLG